MKSSFFTTPQLLLEIILLGLYNIAYNYILLDDEICMHTKSTLEKVQVKLKDLGALIPTMAYYRYVSPRWATH